VGGLETVGVGFEMPFAVLGVRAEIGAHFSSEGGGLSMVEGGGGG